jgi:hypothetical protein
MPWLVSRNTINSMQYCTAEAKIAVKKLPYRARLSKCHNSLMEVIIAVKNVPYRHV